MERRQGGHSFFTTATDGLLFREEEKESVTHSYRIASKPPFCCIQFQKHGYNHACVGDL